MGSKFDRGMQLYEFDALREPEHTNFPLIGEFLRNRFKFVEIPTPQMLWNRQYWPDLYISNQLDAVPEGMTYEDFTETFIEPMCMKIGGIHWTEVEKGLHRALWLPLYWPETIRSRQSIPTRFFYPREGYAGIVAETFGTFTPKVSEKRVKRSTVPILLALVKARVDKPFSVLFVLDESPIYRVTDMDACAGLDREYHRLVVEFRGNSGIISELDRLRIAHDVQSIGFEKTKLTLPVRENVEAGHNFSNNMNAQLWQLLQKNTKA